MVINTGAATPLSDQGTLPAIAMTVSSWFRFAPVSAQRFNLVAHTLRNKTNRQGSTT